MKLRINRRLSDSENGDLNTGYPIDESERASRRLQMNLIANGLQSIDDVIFFETDEAFEEFAVRPVALVDDQGSPYGIYSEAYKKAIEEGKKFVIMKGSFDSKVNRRGYVTKRVQLPKSLGSPRVDMLVQLKVENVCINWVE